MESENPSGESAFDTRVTKAEFPDSFENRLEENHVKIESEPVNANDKCSSPKLLRRQLRKKSCGKDTSNKYIISTDEDEPKQKKPFRTREQRERYNASSRVESQSYEQIEHRRARQRLCQKKLTPEQHQQKLLSRRKNALTPEQIEHRNLRSKECYWRKKRHIQELRTLKKKSGRIETVAENPSGEFASDRLTKAEFPDSIENCLEQNHAKMECVSANENDSNHSSSDLLSSQTSEQSSEENTSEKSFFSTDEEEPLQPRPKKRVRTQEQKERYKAMSRVGGLSYEQLKHKRAYARAKYWRKRRPIQEKRKQEEKSGRTAALAKMRQEIKVLKEQLKHTTEPNERNKLRRRINNRIKKETLLETAIDCNLEKVPPLPQKRTPLTLEQRERRRLYDIQYRLKKKQKMIESASNTSLENKSE